jgi:hypothetical protein
MFDAIRKLSRSNRIVYIMGKLSVLAYDDGPEFDSLIERIIKRLETYEAKIEETKR